MAGTSVEMSDMGETRPAASTSSAPTESDRRTSSEIIAIATQMRQQGVHKAQADLAEEELKELSEVDQQQKEAPGDCCDCFRAIGGTSKDSARENKLKDLKKEMDIDWHTKPIEQLKKEYGTVFTVEQTGVSSPPWKVPTASIKGVTAEQSQTLRQQYGKNMLTPPPKKSEFVKFCEQLTGFFSLLLWAGGFLCFIGYGLQGALDNLYLGIVLCVVVFATGCFGYIQEKKSSDLMDSFAKMMPQNVKIIRDGVIKATVAENLVPGDIVKLKYGDKVPADVRLIQCDGMTVDNAALTGEAEPQKRNTETTDENPLETKNLAFFGTSIVKGQGHGIVVAVGDNTVMGRIAALASGTVNEDSPIAKEIHHFVLIVSGVAFVLGITFFVVGMLLGTDIITNLVFMIGIIVANVPEGLLATVTVCMALTAHRMATNNVMVKNLEGVETLGSTSCICSDKTGTLTQNLMTVEAVVVDGRRFNAECGANVEDPELAKQPSFEKLLDIASLCNTVEWVEASRWPKQKNPKAGQDGEDPFIPDKSGGVMLPFKKYELQKVDKQGTTRKVCKYIWQATSDATEQALAKFAQDKKDMETNKAANPEVTKVPFGSAHKYQVSVRVNEAERKLTVFMKGAPERVMNRCDTIWFQGKKEPFAQGNERWQEITRCQQSCAEDGLRVLGFASLELTGADYQRYCGTSGSPKDFEWEADKLKANFPLGNEPGAGLTAASPDSQQKLTFCGLYAMIDPERPQVPGAVTKCKTAGIRVIMVTGDHPDTAQAIAKKVGIIWGDPDRGGGPEVKEQHGKDYGPATTKEYARFNMMHGLEKPTSGTAAVKKRITITKKDGSTFQLPNEVAWFDPRLAPAVVVPGWEINGNEDNDDFWEDVLAHTQIVFARTSPQQKLVIVEHCQGTGEIVAVTGDGVNDAPALKKADIGVAMGIMGSDVSKEAADMILLDDNFASIVAGVEEGRLIFDNLKKSIAYTLSSNIPEIAPFICFITLMVPLPLSTVLILCVDLGTDMVPAISMAWENKESDIMRRPPREAGRDRLVTRKLVVFAYLQIGVIQAIAGFYTWFVVMMDYGFPAHILPGLGQYDAWGKQLLWCKPNDDAVKFVGFGSDGEIDTSVFKRYSEIKAQVDAGFGTSGIMKSYPFWLGRDDNLNSQGIEKCTYAGKGFSGVDGYNNAGTCIITAGTTYHKCTLDNTRSCKTDADCAAVSIDNWYWPEAQSRMREVSPGGGTYMNDATAKVLEAAGYVPYINARAVKSPFWRGKWMRMDWGSTFGAVGFGDASEDIMKLYQPGGTFKLKVDTYHTTTDFCGTDLQPDGSTKCCGYVKNDCAQGQENSVGCFVRTVPFDEAGVSYDSAEDNSEKMKDAFDDSDCYVTYQCGANNVAVKGRCSLYNKKFENHFYYATSSIVSDGVATTSNEYNFYLPQWDQLSTVMMDGCTPGTATALGCNNAGATPCDKNFCSNVGSRNVQKEALHHAQCAYFVCIVIVQWADLVICKTRMNSIYHQGMLNPAMNYGLIFETLLACILCYTPGLTFALGTRPLKFLHWMPGIPYSIFIFLYDETRKKIMRHQVKMETDRQTGQVIRIPGWVERNSYY